MEQIYPLHEEYIHSFCGMPVCIVTTEGKRHVGILSGCKGGRLTLNGMGTAGTAGISSEIRSEQSGLQDKGSRKKSKSKKGAAVKAKEKAETKSYPYDPYYPYPYYPFAEAFAIDLSAIAFLFLLL